MRMLKASLWSSLFILCASSPAGAHAIGVYASTPFTPPEGWLWVPVALVLASIAWEYFLLGAPRSFHKLALSILMQLICFAILFVALFGFGLAVSIFGIGLLPSLGLPEKPFYGMSPAGAAIPFLLYNLLGLCVLLSMKKQIYAPLKDSHANMRKRLLWGNAVIYVALLVPYICTNALTHGWTGPRFRIECRRKVHELAAGLVRHADVNGGVLPVASNTQELIDVISPYLRETERFIYSERGIEFCPSEAIFSRDPKPYIWNNSFSARRLDNSTEIRGNEPVLRCPAVHDFDQSHASYYFMDLLKLETTDLEVWHRWVKPAVTDPQRSETEKKASGKTRDCDPRIDTPGFPSSEGSSGGRTKIILSDAEKFILSTREGDAEKTGVLLAGGIDCDVQDAGGWTALMHASKAGNTHLVEVLLKAGADPNVMDFAWHTPLMNAAWEGHTEVVRLLLKGGADPNSVDAIGWTPLMHASRNGHTETVEALLAGGSVHEDSGSLSSHWNSLKVAAAEGHTEIMRMLITRGGDVNENRYSPSPLMIAAAKGQTESVQVLLEAGAHVYPVDYRGWTAMKYAQSASHSAIFKLLRDAWVRSQQGVQATQ